MRRTLVVACLCLLCGCARSTEVVSTSEAMTTEVTSETLEVDTAFGVPCRYVSGEDEMEGLMCQAKEVRPEWSKPADGWNLHMDGDLCVIGQVYDKDGILLLPTNYGSNTYGVIGLDYEEKECDTCPDKE